MNVLWSNPSLSPLGEACAQKISVNSHGDPQQPGEGDFVGDAGYINTEMGRRRIWAQTRSISIGDPGTVTAAAQELDVNNDHGQTPDEPGGPRSIYGSWVSGTTAATHVGSAACLITTQNGQWRTGIYIDRADCGIRMGGTMTNFLGADFHRSRIRFAPLTAPPPPPPAGSVELYMQWTPSGKAQLIARFARSWVILATEA